MDILNFSHPLTDDQIDQIVDLTGLPLGEVVDVKVQFDHFQLFELQAQTLVESLGKPPRYWQTAPILVVLPGLSVIAALLLAELHGRMGYFPTILRLRSIAGSMPPQFEVAEIIGLNMVREVARTKR
jgi:hypothetical protein